MDLVWSTNSVGIDNEQEITSALLLLLYIVIAKTHVNECSAISNQVVNKLVKESILSAVTILAGNLFHLGMVDGMFINIYSAEKDGQLVLMASGGGAVVVYTVW